MYALLARVPVPDTGRLRLVGTFGTLAVSGALSLVGGPPASFLALALLAVSLAVRPAPASAPTAVATAPTAVDPDEASWLGLEPPEVPEVDVEELRGRIGDDPELFGALVDAYVADTPRRVAELRQAVEAGDWTRVARAGHALRGTLGLVAARPAHEAVVRIEAAAALADRAAALVALEELEVRAGRLSAALAALRGGPTA